jgi:O-antigen ligase
MALLLPIVAALSAILVLSGWSFFFDVIPKVVVILLGAALVFVLNKRKGYPFPIFNPTPAQPATHLTKDPAAKPLLYFTAIAAAQAIVILLAAIFSTHPRLSFLGSTWRRSGAIAEIAVLVLAVFGAGQLVTGRSSSRRIFLRITVLASLPISIYGILQYFGVDPLLAPAGYHFGEGPFMIVRPPSTLGHAAYFATYLLYVAFAGAELVRLESAEPRPAGTRILDGDRSSNSVPIWKIAAIAASVIGVFAIVLSGTRAALLGLLVGAVFTMIAGHRRALVVQGHALPAAVKRTRSLAALTLLLVIVIAGFYLSPAGERLRARAFWASEDRLGGSRLLLWRDSLRMSRKHWLLGYGSETFAVEFPLHQSLDLARAFPDFYHESPHNIFLDALVSKGVFGLTALLALTLLCLAFARGPLGGAFVAMLVSQQFTTFTLTTELYFYLTAALLLSDFTPQRSVTIRPRVLWAIPFLGMAAYLTIGDTLLAASRRALDRNDAATAARIGDRARRWHMAADVYFSRRYAAVASQRDPIAGFTVWQYALAAARQAPETAEDRQNALINLAALQSTASDADAVERTLRRAVAAAPMYFKSHWLLAQVLELEGRTAAARAEARAAFDRDGGKHAEVTALWERLKPR